MNEKVIARDRLRQHDRMTSAWGKRLRAALNAAMLPLKGANWNQSPEALAERLDLYNFSTLMKTMYSQMIKWDVPFTANYYAKSAPLRKDELGFPSTYDSVLWWQNITRQYIEELGTANIVTLNQMTREMAVKVIRDAVIAQATLTSGLDSYELAQMIERTVLLEWRNLNSFRAFRIARTELHQVMNYSADKTVSNFGYRYIKVWRTVMDGRERQSHAAVNGERREQHEPFSVGNSMLMYPGAPGGAGEDVINCRCTCIHRAVLPQY